MDQNQNTSLFQLNLDAQNSYTLRSAASWAKVMGVVSIIIAVLCIIMGVLVQQIVSQNSRSFRSETGISANAFGNAGLIVYIILALVFLVSGMFSLNAGNKINLGLKANDQASLNAGFAATRNFFAFWTILTIIFLLLILIGLLGAM